MEVVIALTVAIAVLAAALAIVPAAPESVEPRRSWLERTVERRRTELAAARLHFDARRFTLLSLAAPPLLLCGGLALGSPVVALGGGAAGFMAPRLYLDWLLRQQRRRTEAEAPRVLHILLASLAGGRTYLEAIEEARTRTHDRWLRDDLDEIIHNFHLDIPLEQSIAAVRKRSAGRNLALIWDNLAICIGNRIPASKAKGLFAELSNTVQFNVQLQQEVKARTSGQRAQIWMLAAIVPGLFLYLRFLNPEFFAVLDNTVVGRFVLFPGAVALEVTGLWLSFRVARLEV